MRGWGLEEEEEEEEEGEGGFFWEFSGFEVELGGGGGVEEDGGGVVEEEAAGPALSGWYFNRARRYACFTIFCC